MSNSKSKVLILGCTGYIGTWITKACLASNHETILLVRKDSAANIQKAQLILSYKQAGARIVEGSLDDHLALISLLSDVDFVVSAMAENQLLLQLKLVQAIKEVGTVKRFLPSEYGMDPDMMEHAIHPGSIVFQEKRRVRRAIEEAGIPHTFMVANCFAGYFLSGLAQLGRFWPPKEDVLIYGDGNAKVVWMVEKDIGTYAINAMDDPRTLNRTIHMRPLKNVLSQLEVVNIWEKLSNKTLKKVYITEKQWLQQIDDNKDHGMEYKSAVAIFYHIFFKGDIMSFSISQDNEASMLYPHIQYTDVESYLSDFVWA